MRFACTLAAVSLMALATPALAQQAGAPNASTGPLAGHNPPGSGQNSNGMNEGRATAPDQNTGSMGVGPNNGAGGGSSGGAAGAGGAGGAAK